MGSINLPSKDSADVYLATATPEEAEALQHANSSEWKGALNVEAYLRREKYLGAQDLTKDGGLTSWVLVWQPGPAAERQVLSGCETIKKRALVSRDGNVEEVICHGLCSVFCPPAFRGRGYASRMRPRLGRSWRTGRLIMGKHICSACSTPTLASNSMLQRAGILSRHHTLRCQRKRHHRQKASDCCTAKILRHFALRMKT